MGLESATYINDLDATNPAAGDQASQGDDHIRLIKAVLKTTFPSLGAPITFAAAEVTIASATTCDILGAASDRVAISGSVTITGLGTGINRLRYVRFTGAPLLTYNATSLILPGAANIQAAAGDTMIVEADGSSNVRCLVYQKASGLTLLGYPDLAAYIHALTAKTPMVAADELLLIDSAAANVGKKILFSEILKGTIGTFGAMFDGNTIALAANSKIRLGPFDFQFDIDAVTLTADQAGSIVIDVQVDTYANYPPNAADSICASAKPTLSSAIKSQDTTLTGWTKTVASGKSMILNVDSASTLTQCAVAFKYHRS